MIVKRVAHNRLTSDKVIEQFKQVHGDDFGYENVIYVGTHTKVEIYCKKHNLTFHQTPKNHKQGSKCYYCGRENQIEKAKKGIEEFTNELFKVYGYEYDFSKIDYVNTKTEIEVLCKTHGSFMRKPCDLLNGVACKKCKLDKSKYNNKELFIKESTKLFGDITDYSLVNEMGARNKVTLICTKHKCEFTLTVSSRLAGQKCPKCSAENYSKIRTKTTEEFVSKAKEVHGDNCDYTDTIYKSCNEKISVKCNIHNLYFETIPENHMRGGRCRKCLSENISNALKGKEGTCGYTRSRYIAQAGDREAYVYIIRCWNENEEFYKIGKTFLDIDKRFTKGNICYNFEKVKFHIGEAGYIYDLENELHRKYKEFKYKPENWFAGHTECFNINLPIKNVFES